MRCPVSVYMRSSRSCHLCGLPVGKAQTNLKVSGETLYFCCTGCRMVYTMLTESDPETGARDYKETELYQRCLEAGIIPATEADLAARESSSKDVAPSKVPPSDSDTTLSVNLAVEGMWCPACAWVIETALSKAHGITKSSCAFSTDHVSVQYDPLKTSPGQISDIIDKLGYSAVSLENGKDKKSHQKAFTRLFVSLLFSANVMMLSWALYSGFFITLPPDGIRKIAWILFFMASIVFFYGGMPIHKKAWAGIIHGMPGMESLISIGAIITFGYSIYNLFAGSIHLYFDTSSMLIVLILIGKMLESRAKQKISRDLESFFSIMPKKVRMVTDQDPRGRYVTVEQIEKGGLFKVGESEIVPADGFVVEGLATLDLSSLTGEPNPVAVKPGDSVKSGSLLNKGGIVIRARCSAEDSVLGQMIRIMRESLDRKGSLENRFSRVLKIFVPGIVGLSLITAIFLVISGYPPHEVIERAVAVVVISCPCALGIAAPLALIAGISKAGKQGILVRDGDAFEQSLGIDTIVFDKTGTITTGKWQIIDIVVSGTLPRDKIIALAAGLEKNIDHHIAHTVVSYAGECGISPLPMDHVKRHPNGVSADVSGQRIRLGNFDFVRDGKLDAPKQAFHSKSNTTDTCSYLYMTIDSNPAALLVFGDKLRSSSVQTIASLKKMGYKTILVSGDSIGATKHMTEKTGMDQFFGAMMPGDKAAYIDRLLKKDLHPAMVGDGINDAPAMTKADLSIAVYSGSHLGREVAGVTLMNADPGQLIPFFSLSARVSRKVRQNLLFACIYNLSAIPVAMSGLLNPLVAATTMLLSSLTVIGNTLLLLKQEQHEM